LNATSPARILKFAPGASRSRARPWEGNRETHRTHHRFHHRRGGSVRRSVGHRPDSELDAAVRQRAMSVQMVYEFAFFITPLKLQGAIGSTVAPIAIR
jgi:hypothetical protein